KKASRIRPFPTRLVGGERSRIISRNYYPAKLMSDNYVIDSQHFLSPARQPMSGSVVLLHLAGAVALMLFATRMVRTGVERAYGDVLRRRLRATMRNPVMAVLAGIVLSIALQSST